MPYVELCIKSNFTFLKGGSHPEEYASRATELGLECFAITDENSVAGVVRAHAEIKRIVSSSLKFHQKNSINSNKASRLIPGTEINITEGIIITALAKNRTGWANICRLITEGNKNEKKGVCKITLEDILTYGNEMVFLLHMPEENIKIEPSNSWINLVKKIVFNFPDTALVISPKYDGLDYQRFAKTAQIAKILKVRLAASAHPIMHHGSRRRLLDILTAIRNKSKIESLGLKASKNAERRMRSNFELEKIFSDYHQALNNSKIIAQSCKFSLDELQHDYPSEISNGAPPIERLTRLTNEGLRWRYPKGIPNNVKKQVNHELKLIRKLNYSPYFLTVYDIVKFARSRDILCQGRGSAANSIVCFSLGITSVSPEIGTMVFERFVSEARNEPPDIDVDFEHERREEVIQYIYEKFGRHRTGLCATVVHYRKKRALREIGKAMGLSQNIIEKLSSELSGWIKLEKDETQLQKIGLNPLNNRLAQILKLVKELIGFPRHLSQHVGGFILTENRLDELVPIENATMKNRTVICWDKNDIDILGILKVDILSLGILTCIKKAFSLIYDFHGVQYTLATLPPEDTDVYEMLCNADTVGVFQVESRAQMNFLPRMQPRCFYDLVIEIAIVRPGPIQGNMVHPYLKRRTGKEKVTFPSSSIKTVLEKTLGIPLFQEQAMQIAIIGAGFTPEEADSLRRSLAAFKKTGTIRKFRDRFIKGMLKNGYKETFSKNCFSQIEGFGEYGFPESHAASFALLVYASAWLKKHYPGIFACSLLNSQPMGFYAPAQIIIDAQKHHVDVRPVCINNSQWNNTMEPSKNNSLALRIGFKQIKGLSKEESNLITKARSNGYTEVYDVWHRSGVSHNTITKIAKADCFFSLGLSRQEALWEVKTLKSKNIMPLFKRTMEGEKINEPKVTLPKPTLGNEIIKDYSILNFTLRKHPIALLRPILEKIDPSSTINRNNITITTQN